VPSAPGTEDPDATGEREQMTWFAGAAR